MSKNLDRLGLVDSVRGRGGDIRLVTSARQVTIGSVMRHLEPAQQLVDCNDGACLLNGFCELDLALQRAMQAFINELDKYSLSDLVVHNVELQQIVGLRSRDRAARSAAEANGDNKEMTVG